MVNGPVASIPALFELAQMSETLSDALAAYGVVMVLLLTGLVLVFMGARFAARSTPMSRIGLLRDEGGAALSSDFILVAVPVLVFVTLMVQMTWFMRETVIVHYAAYSAARSAKSHACPSNPAGANARYLVASDILCEDGSDAPERAARFALIPAAPPWDIPCLGNCAIPQQVLATIAGQSGIPERQNMLVRQARYAFDTSNVDLDIETDNALMALAGQTLMTPGARPAVKAELVFRNYVLKWVGRLLGTKRSDGLYYRETRAVVRLL